MSKLRELKTAMPADFVEQFRQKAEFYGMTHRQLAATCIAMGYKTFCDASCSSSLPSEPSPVVAEIEEKAAVSRVDEGDGAKRRLPLTLRAAFGAISHKKRGTSVEG